MGNKDVFKKQLMWLKVVAADITEFEDNCNLLLFPTAKIFQQLMQYVLKSCSAVTRK